MMKIIMENILVKTLNSEEMRSVMRAWSAGIAVVSAVHEDARHGMTVNSFTSISLYPAFVSVSLQKSTRTHDLVFKSHTFGVTMLSESQTDLSDIFAGRNPEIEDRFADVKTETLVTGAPLIAGALAWLDCRVVQTFDAGMNTLFIAEVLAARSFGEGVPLVYHDRGYWKLSKL
jgi:flavin reductase (DIM6/NTAB) family NADH-FMN oxidoreductase RutF